MKKFLSIMLAAMMLVSLFAVNASAATGEYVQVQDPFYEEDFDGATHSFDAYGDGAAWTGGLVDGDTGEGNAFKVLDMQAATVNFPENYTVEFDFYHTNTEATSSSNFQIKIADADSTATVKNFGLYVGVLPFTANKWYSMKMVVDESKLTATGNTPAGAVTLYWKAKGATDWNLAIQDTDNTFDSSTTLYYRSHNTFGTTLFGGSDIGFGGKSLGGDGNYIVVDNLNAYVYKNTLVAAHDYAAKEDFSGATYSVSNVSVSGGVATTTAGAAVSAELPEKFVIEFDLKTSGTTDGYYDVYFKDTDCTAQPHLGLRLIGGSFDPTKTYTYKFIIDQSLLVNDNGNTQVNAIKWFRKEAGTNTWVAGGYTTGFNAILASETSSNGYNMSAYNDSTGARVNYTGGYVPIVRPHNGIGSASLSDNRVVFMSGGTIDNIKISGLGAVRVSEIANDTTIGAKIEFNDADATDLSTTRTVWLAAYNDDVLADVDFESVNAANGLYTAELSVDKAAYDEVKVYVWETADNASALPEVFDLKAWLQ